MQNKADIDKELSRLNINATSKSFNHYGFLVTELVFAIDKNVTKVYHTHLLIKVLRELRTNQGIITALHNVEF